MAFLISDLYSLAPSRNIEWYLYVLDVSERPEGTVEGRYVREHFLDIGRQLGCAAAIVAGTDDKPQRQIREFLGQHLDAEIRDAVQLVTVGCMSILATQNPLPHSDAMAIIPLSNRRKPFDSPARAAEVEMNIRRIVASIADGSMQRLIDAEESLRIQQGHFDLPITDTGMLLLKRLNRWVRLKIPFLLGEVDCAAIIDDWLARYPTANR